MPRSSTIDGEAVEQITPASGVAAVTHITYHGRARRHARVTATVLLALAAGGCGGDGATAPPAPEVEPVLAWNVTTAGTGVNRVGRMELAMVDRFDAKIALLCGISGGRALWFGTFTGGANEDYGTPFPTLTITWTPARTDAISWTTNPDNRAQLLTATQRSDEAWYAGIRLSDRVEISYVNRAGERQTRRFNMTQRQASLETLERWCRP